MSYFSDREQGPKPRIVEEINQTVWGGIIANIRSRISDGSFGCRFPKSCSDDGGLPYGCDESLFDKTIIAEIPDLPSPSNDEEQVPPTLTVLDYLEFHYNKVPPTLAVLDLLEFCYKAVGKPVSLGYHEYGKHNHLRFKSEEGQTAFRNDVNIILARNGLAYDLNPDGLIERLPSEVLGVALKSARFQTGDTELNSLLETAREKYLDPDLKVRKEALKELWGAWERLKTIAPGEKKESIKVLLDKCAPEAKFRETIEKEAIELTHIGNTFGIRHTETSQISLEKSEHVDYLFHRLFALINMLLKYLKFEPVNNFV